MRAKGLAWLGTRTAHFADMVRFAADVLGLRLAVRAPTLAVFKLDDGSLFEIFAAEDPEHRFIHAPVGGFLVDDVDAARAEMEAKGTVFIGPTHRVEGGNSWAHFVAPDGHVYELTTAPR